MATVSNLSSLRRIFSLCLIVTSLVFTPLHFSISQASDKQEAVAPDKKVTETFVDALTLIEDHFSGKLDHNQVVQSSIAGMLHSLDPHSNFFSREDFLDFRSQQLSQYSGVGATIVPHNNKVYVLSPFPNTPAFRAGLRYGDQIISIDNQSTEKWNTDKVRNNLRGLRGIPVNVTVLRAGSDKPLTLRVVRDSVDLPSISNIFLIRPEIGYIGLRRGFARTTTEEIVAALKQLKADGAKSILLDLRDNPGGLVDAAHGVANQFLKKGQKIYSFKGRDKNGIPYEQNFTAENNDPNTLPLVVLINGGSASASEIVAGALQDHDRSIIVGENSFGKGLVQTIYPISEGCGLSLTSAKYFTPSGRLLQREYEGRSLYEYYKHTKEDNKNKLNSKNNFQTDTKRIVQSGRGIEPDINIEGTTINLTQFRIQDVTFSFVRLLVAGQIPGFPEYKINDVSFQHTLTNNDYVITDKLFTVFKKYTEEHSKEFEISLSITNQNINYIKQQLRRELVTASHGVEISTEVVISDDKQVLRAIEEIPNAKQLAEKSNKIRQDSENASNTLQKN